jgi:alcohol dehydrogenase class IV
MWYFSSPDIIFGEDALSHLGRLKGKRACIVSDANLTRLGFAGRVRACLPLEMESSLYDDIEPNPSLETVRRGAAFLLEQKPDWIIAVGGGSVLDAAKGMWVLYECPDVDPAGINPIETYGLRSKAHFAAVPTTAGTGSEATYAVVLTDPAERRKLGLGSREDIPDLAILDPALVMELPPQLTAETGLDALTHAIEGYSSTFHNDFSDGLCLMAARLIFTYLRRAYRDGADVEARQHTQNAAAMAGLGFGNSMAALAHGLGHALGGVFHTSHGKAVSLFLPYSIEYCVRGEADMLRYTELAGFLGLDSSSQESAARSLVQAIRQLQQDLGLPLNLQDAGISLAELEKELDLLAANALNDSQTVMSTRIPDETDLRRLFLAAWNGSPVDF